MLPNRSGITPGSLWNGSLIAPDTPRPAPDTLPAAQGARSGVSWTENGKGKFPGLRRKHLQQ